MPFSSGQQGHFQPLKQRAWHRHCELNPGVHPGDKNAQRAWYEEELKAATSKTSTTACNTKRDFEDVMAHFEALAGDGIYWQMRRHGGDARRILHEVRQLAQEFDCDEQYMQGIAKQALKRDTLPDLATLTAEELIIILVSLNRQVRRQKARGDRTDKPRRIVEVDEPF